MRRIRKCLKSTVAQERFPDLALLDIEEDMTSHLSLEEILARKRGTFCRTREELIVFNSRAVMLRSCAQVNLSAQLHFAPFYLPLYV